MVRETLQQISDLLDRHNRGSPWLTSVLSGDDDDHSIWEFAASNTLWGAKWSIADQALLDIPHARAELGGLLLKLGREQLRLGTINEHTPMWVAALEKWQAGGGRWLSPDARGAA